MTKLSLALAFLMYQSAIGFANEASAKCTAPKIVSDTLAITECAQKNQVTLVTYREPSSLSPYATALDQRSVVVGYGPDMKQVKEAAGILSNNGSDYLSRTLLTAPPMAEAVESRKPTSSSTNRGRWVVFFEQIQYGAEGGGQGYVIDCGTALKTVQATAIAVAECFSLEDRQRFLNTLDQIR